MRYINIYLIFINCLTFVLFVTDKIKARRGKFRIPEKTLLSAMALGGSLGSLMGMVIARHKTRKKVFVWGTVAALAIHTALYIWISTKLRA